MADLECGLSGVVGPDRVEALLLRLRSLCDAAPLADAEFKYHDQVYLAGAQRFCRDYRVVRIRAFVLSPSPLQSNSCPLLQHSG